MTRIRTRIAPSPTGTLHLGTVHTALFNYAFARHHSGDFILRIDDSDKERSKKEFEENIIQSFKWLGIQWDEGPDIGGPARFYRQSERSAIYKKYLDMLLKEDTAYYCYCTKEELEKEKNQAEDLRYASRYSGRCRHISEKEKDSFEKEGRRPVIRLINPNKTVAFTDIVRGTIIVDTTLFGDFVIARGDGSALLNFAATVDDLDMNITHAIRGEDFLNMVPRQLLIFEALHATPPEFAHLSFLYAPDKTKLSKRHGATSVSEYEEMGYLKDALINYLGTLGYSFLDGREFFSLADIIRKFDIKRVQKGAPVFSLNKLQWFNGHYIRKLSDEELKMKLVQHSAELQNADRDVLLKIIPFAKDRMKTLNDFYPLTEFFFKRPQNYEIDISSQSILFDQVVQSLKKVETWRAEVIGERMQAAAQEAGIKNSEFFMNLRVAITGKKISPPLNESMEILGKKEVITRLERIGP